MDLIYSSQHGGQCCGISHIFFFSSFPENMMNARQKIPIEKLIERYRDHPHLYGRLNYELPQQTAMERVVQTIENIEKSRPNGIIEAVLTQNQCVVWQKILEDLKFKVVNSSRNSNSGNTIFVFHRNSGE